MQGEDAWVFYFTHPGRVPGEPPPPRAVRDVEPYALRRTSVQVAKLELEGTEIVCRRDEPFPFRLQSGVDNWTRSCCGGTTGQGHFKIRRQTARKRLEAKPRKIKQPLRRGMHEPVPKAGEWSRHDRREKSP